MGEPALWQAEVGVVLKPSQNDTHGRWEIQTVLFDLPESFYSALRANDRARILAMSRYSEEVILHTWVISLENIPRHGKGLKAVNTEVMEDECSHSQGETEKE